MIKSSKIYFFDTGVLNAIRKELGIEISGSSLRSGKLFESFIINEIYRNNHYHEWSYSLYHWRTKNGEEVDLVLNKNKMSHPIALEIKMTTEVIEDDLKGLIAFKNEEKKARLICVCNTPKNYMVEGVEIINWKDIFSML